MKRDILKIFTHRRIAITCGLGFASGLPLPLTSGTLQGWMKTENVDLAVIGIFSLVGLPYTLKFLWAPLLDRFSPPFLGRRTGWIVVFQALLILSIVIMAGSNPVNAPGFLAMIAFVVAFLSASQDIVIDAYRAELLPERELGVGAAVTVLGARLALLVSGALAFILSEYMSWRYVYLLMAITLGLGLITTLFSPEPESQPKTPRSLQEAVIGPMVDYFRRKGALEILLFVILYKLGDAIAGAMTTPFLMEIGFSRGEIGAVSKGFGLLMTILGALFGGGILAQIGILRSLWVFGILQCFSNFVFVALSELGPKSSLLYAAIGIENLCGGMGTAAFVAFLMSLCNKEFTATQYALLSSVMAIARTVAGVPTGYMAKHMGWTWFFIASACFAIPGLLFLARVRQFSVVSKSA